MRSIRTAEHRAAVMAALGSGASYTIAAERAGIARSALFKWRKDDPNFDQDCLDAEEEGTDRLEDEAMRRARHGVLKPILYKGEQVAEIREYSDTLMVTMLKARRPDRFKDRQQIQHEGTIETMDDAQIDKRIADLIASAAARAATPEPARKARAAKAPRS